MSGKPAPNAATSPWSATARASSATPAAPRRGAVELRSFVPTVFKREGYRFYFFSNEGDPREPPHVHVRRGGDEAKFWLQPEVAVAESFGFNAAELNALVRMVSEEGGGIERVWNGHFGNGG